MKRLLPLPLLLLTLPGSLAYSQSPDPAPASDARQAGPPSPAQAESPLQQDPQMLCGRLENGLRYIIRPTSEPRGRASMRLYVETGSLDESPETSGISHFIEHMVFNGSRHFKRGELIPTMQNLGLGFGGDANALTGMQNTVYMLELPNLRPETVNFSLTILRDFADGATLADEDIERERGIIISEMKARDSASYRAELELLRKFLGGTRVVDYQPIGTEEVIRNCPAETIRRYYQEHYVPSRMVVIITGDISPAQAEQWVREHFSSMVDRPAPERPAPGQPTDRGSGCFIVPDAEAADSTLTLAVVRPWTFRPDTLEQRVSDLPLELACTMLNRRLSRLSRQADSPCLSASVSPRENACEAAEIFSLRLTTRPEQWQAGLAAAEAELRRAALYGFSDTELKEALAALHARQRKSIETWPTVTAQTVANRLVSCLSNRSLFTTPAEDARAWAAGIRRVLATPGLCQEALARACAPEQTRIVLSGKVAEGLTPDALATAYAAARQQKVEAAEQQQLSPFTYDHIGEPGDVTARNHVDDLGITTLTFSNGVRVNLKPLGRGMGRIYVSAAVEGGTIRLQNTPALAEMAQAVMSRGGLEAHNAEELSRLFAGHNVSSSFGMDDERFVFSGTTSPQDLELQCKLLCAAILHPGYRPEGEMQLRRKLPSFFRGIATTPEGAFGDLAVRDFFGENTRFLVPTPAQFAAVNTAAVKSALTPFLEKGALEVTLVGDFQADEVLPILQRSFGAMPARAAEFSPLPEEARRVEFSPWGRSVTLPYDTQLDKTIIAEVRPAGNGRDLQRSRCLNILRGIVAGRLFASIRAELGEGYSPSVQVDLRRGYENAATITAMSVGVKKNQAKVAAAMERVSASIGRGEIQPEEFQLAMRPYLADVDMAYRLPTFWMGNMLRLQSDPQALEMLRGYRSGVSSITLEEIRQLAREIYGMGKANYYFTVPRATEAQRETPAVPATLMQQEKSAS